MATSTTTNLEIESKALGLPNTLKPNSWSQLVLFKDIKCSFYKSQSTASPTSSDSEGTKAALRPSQFRPSQRNVIVAAHLTCSFLARIYNDSPDNAAFALVGGVAMKVWGLEDRNTHDVDVCIKGDINSLLRALLRSDRFVLPESKLFAHVLCVFIKIGPRWGDTNANGNNLVQIQFLLEGFGSAPFSNGCVSVGKVINGFNGRFRCLGVVLLFWSKIASYAGRERAEDWTDAAVLLHNHRKNIEAQRDRLDHWNVRFFLQNPPRNLAVPREWFQVLTGKSPSPPSSRRGS